MNWVSKKRSTNRIEQNRIYQSINIPLNPPIAGLGNIGGESNNGFKLQYRIGKYDYSCYVGDEWIGMRRKHSLLVTLAQVERRASFQREIDLVKIKGLRWFDQLQQYYSIVVVGIGFGGAIALAVVGVD